MLAAAGHAAIARFVAKRLGVFGYWHQANPRIVDAVMAREARVSWCVNNCFNKELLGRLRAVAAWNKTVGSMLTASPLVKVAFNKQKRFVVGT